MEKKRCLSLADSRAVSADDTDKMLTPFSCSDDDDAYALFSGISGRLDVKQFCFLFPDSFNEFRLAPIRKASRVFYREIDALPQSVGAVFHFETNYPYNAGDLVIVADIVGNELTLTPIKGVVDSSIGALLRERRPIVWERYPTAAYDISEERGERFGAAPCLEELFPGELSDSEKRIPILVKDNWSDAGAMDGASDGVRIDGYLEDYIKSHRWLAKGNIVVLSLSDGLDISNIKYTKYRIPKSLCVEGYRLCGELSRQAGKALWKDHLPNLSIRQVCSVFDLVKNRTVIPRANEEILIKIDNTFTLPAGRERYSFELMQEDTTGRMKYQAVLEHSAFPLKSPVKCRLVMKYKYGADDPYTLRFTPLDKAAAGFSEVTAKWRDAAVEDYTYSDNVYPGFPPALDIARLRSFPPKPPYTEPTNLFSLAMGVFEPIYSYSFTGEETWITKGNSSYTDIRVRIGVREESVRLYDDGTIRKADKIYFQVSLVRQKFYRAQIFFKRVKGYLFALHKILAGGRRLSEIGYPAELRAAVRNNNGNAWQAYKSLSDEAKNSPGIDQSGLSAMLSMFCLLYDEMDDELADEFYAYLIDMADSHGKRLNANIGCAIGACDTEARKKLFEKTVEICEAAPTIGINILSRAVWGNPAMVFNAPAERLLDCMEIAVKYIARFGGQCGKNNGTADKHTLFYASGCLEFILAVFRLRAKNDEAVNSRLRCGSQMIEKLREALYKIVKTNDSELFKKIDESVRVKLEMSDSSNERVPGIISAIMHYAAGTLENDSIKISEISEEDSGTEW